jgi:hypothetical protein
MNLTPPSLLSAMRRMNRNNMRSSAVVQEEMVESGAGSSTTKRWIDRLPEPLKCRVSAPGATDQETLIASKSEAKQVVTVVFEDGADVRLSDRFIVTMDDGTVITAYPVGRALRDVEIMRKMICEVR